MSVSPPVLASVSAPVASNHLILFDCVGVSAQNHDGGGQ
jgi:hypothetical protein